MPTFAQVARDEFRATWCGRFRWLWFALALAVEGAMLFAHLEQTIFVNQWSFQLLCVAAAWVPAWLCADLLSLRFKENPQPYLERTPQDFLARAGGRLAPGALAILFWAVTLTTRLATTAPKLPLSELLAFVCAMTLVILTSGITYASTAALLSASSRRPRRFVIAAFLILLAILCDLAAAAWALEGFGPSVALTPELLDSPYVRTPNLWVGLAASMLAMNVNDPKWSVEKACWLASLAFVIYSVLVWTVIWWITGRRFRRQHPNPPEWD